MARRGIDLSIILVQRSIRRHLAFVSWASPRDRIAEKEAAPANAGGTIAKSTE